METPLDEDEFYVRVCKALAFHSLSHGGALEVPAAPANLGYTLGFHENGSVSVEAEIYPSDGQD